MSNKKENQVSMTVEELKGFMIKHKMNAMDLAKLLGLTRPAVDHWVQGRRAVPGPAAKLMRVVDQYPQMIPWVGSIQ